LFPGAGLLVMSAWCLGILNSHHRFLLSYAAPVIWSAAMIAALLWFGGDTPLPRLVVILAWASVVGSALQLAVQLPVVLSVAPELRLAIDTTSVHVRTIVRNFFPAFFSRGVVQLSAYVDTLLASLLPIGAVAGLTNAQTLSRGEPLRHVGVAAERPRWRLWRSPRPPVSRACAAASIQATTVAFFVIRPRGVSGVGDGGRNCSNGPVSMPTRCMCRRFSRDRRSACWPRRSAGCTRQHITRCATRVRRCATQSCASP
jgi:hypothetical protein